MMASSGTVQGEGMSRYMSAVHGDPFAMHTACSSRAISWLCRSRRRKEKKRVQPVAHARLRKIENVSCVESTVMALMPRPPAGGRESNRYARLEGA
jgi:hypothetical protein